MAIAKKVVPLPVYVGALYSLDEELERLRAKVDNATNTDDEKKELYDKINSMRKQIFPQKIAINLTKRGQTSFRAT